MLDRWHHQGERQNVYLAEPTGKPAETAWPDGVDKMLGGRASGELQA